MGRFQVMGPKGDDAKLTWNPFDELAIKKAKDRFQELKAKGYKAFKALDIAGTRKGEEISEFDPSAERIIFVPPMVGG